MTPAAGSMETSWLTGLAIATRTFANVYSVTVKLPCTKISPKSYCVLWTNWKTARFVTGRRATRIIQKPAGKEIWSTQNTRTVVWIAKQDPYCRSDSECVEYDSANHLIMSKGYELSMFPTGRRVRCASPCAVCHIFAVKVTPDAYVTESRLETLFPIAVAANFGHLYFNRVKKIIKRNFEVNF